MVPIVLLVCFVVIMLVWLLSLLAVIPFGAAAGWLAFAACLVLGIAVFHTVNRSAAVPR